jgi:hypothetical protein
MNNMQRYDNALMEGVSPKRLAKQRMKAFIEAVSEIAPRAIVEAVVTAHKALFEFGYGRTPRGVRYVTGTFSSDPSKTNNWGTQTVYNGNDLVATNSRLKPPTSGGTDWHKQTNTGTAAYRTFDDVHTYKTRQRIDPRGYEPSYNVRMDDPWERKSYYEVPQPQQPPPPPPPQPVAPQAVRQQAPQPAPKQECPPVCPAPAPAPAPAPQKEDNREIKTIQQAPEQPKKKPAAQYKWNPKDFQEIQGEGCSETHKFVINLVSYNKNNRGAAMSTARYLAQEEHIPGIYTYQYDGLAQNTTRPDVWRVRIGYFKSRAAARYFFRKYVFPHVGKQFNWWVGTCDGEKGDLRMKKNTFALGKNIKENECVDTSVAKQGSEQPKQNAAETKEAPQTQQGTEQNVQATAQTQAAPQASKAAPQQGVSTEVGEKSIMDLVNGK